jgi:hypothetical protein
LGRVDGAQCGQVAFVVFADLHWNFGTLRSKAAR